MHKPVLFAIVVFCAFDFRFFGKEERSSRASSSKDGLVWSQKGVKSDPYYFEGSCVNTPSQDVRYSRNSSQTIQQYLVRQCTGNCRALTSLVLKTLMGKSATTFPWARLTECVLSCALGLPQMGSLEKSCAMLPHKIFFFLSFHVHKKGARYMVFLCPYLLMAV